MKTTEQTVRQAIRTRYHGATNFNGSRIIASWGGKKKVFHWQYELSAEGNHLAAAAAVAAELGWNLSPAVGVFDNDYYHTAV